MYQSMLKECVVKVVYKSEDENYSQDNSVLCILFRSSMNFYDSLPRLLEICNCFRFVCIVIGEEELYDFLLFLLFFCHQSSFCNRILISCLIHMRQQSVCRSLCVSHLLCVTRFSVCDTFFCVCSHPFVVKHHVFHRSRRNNYLRWVSSDRMNITQFFVCIFTDFKSCFESSAVEALQSILTHEFFPNLLLNTGSMTLLPIRVTSPKNLLVKRVCVYTFLLDSPWCRIIRTWRWEHQRSVFCTSVIQKLWSKFCPLDGFLSLYKWTSFSDAIDEGLLLLLPLPTLLLSRRPGFSRFVEATVSRCMPESLTFASTLLESCEPNSWYSTAGLEDSKHIISKLSSFLRNFEP